ncbi:unnamed protein product [Auanema sp. JU1783]|nr:unnamed protein product [Auanema sp. JU1783]
MNFFKRKFSFTDDEGDSDITTVAFDDPVGPSPPSAFSFQSIANKVSSTISAPTSPARTGESLVAALEKALQDRSRGYPVMGPDAKILLVIDNPIVDWSKYFRNPNEPPVRVEQADFSEIDMMCTEHSCLIEINQPERDKRSFCPDACFIGCGATKSSRSKTILRALIAANIPFLNTHSSMVAFMDRNNLKKQLRKIHYTDGTKIPFLPSVHYPHFQKFHPTTSFPAVVSVNEGYQGYGKMKINTKEELLDVEGLFQLLGKGDTEVEVEPYVDLKYDLHVQKIGEDYKTFIRRSISHNWKSNVGSSILEQIPTSERHKQYIQAICQHVGHMNVCSIDVLISKEGFEYVHAINDCLVYYGESQEHDRRTLCTIVKTILQRNMKTYHHHLSREQSLEANNKTTAKRHPVSQSTSDMQLSRPPTQRINEPSTEQNARTPSNHNVTSHHSHTHNQGHTSSQLPNQLQRSPQRIVVANHNSLHGKTVAPHRQISIEDPISSATTTTGSDSSYSSLADDTMSQLKRTFAGIFGDVN